MSQFAITNPEANTHASELIGKVSEALPIYWKAILPTVMKVTIAIRPFNKIAELKDYCKKQDERTNIPWNVLQVVCPEFDDEEAMIWVYYDEKSIMANPDYYFQKEIYELLAQLMWVNSERLIDLAEGAPYLAFRDSFSRFFLNPRYLAEKKPTAFRFMLRLDAALLKA